MRIAYSTPWVDSDTGRTITHCEIQRTRFPHDDVGMELEFRLFAGDELVSTSTKASPITNPALLGEALNTLAANIKSVCERV